MPRALEATASSADKQRGNRVDIRVSPCQTRSTASRPRGQRPRTPVSSKNVVICCKGEPMGGFVGDGSGQWITERAEGSDQAGEGDLAGPRGLRGEGQRGRKGAASGCAPLNAIEMWWNSMPPLTCPGDHQGQSVLEAGWNSTPRTGRSIWSPRCSGCKRLLS